MADGFEIVHKGNFKHTETFLNNFLKKNHLKVLEKYAQEGVTALASATPKDTGLTAASWGYEIEQTGDTITVYWTNDHIEKYVNIAIILQYGHGTRNGGYVQGRDYINPAIRPIFDKLANAMWKEVTG